VRRLPVRLRRLLLPLFRVLARFLRSNHLVFMSHL
jgi:hypothetical protein